MQYYTFELDEENQNLESMCHQCLQVNPHANGLKYFPGIAQAVMENILSGIDAADVYIEDVRAFSLL